MLINAEIDYIRRHCSRDIYEAMSKNDMSVVVMTVYDIFKNRLQLSFGKKQVIKSEEHSNVLRQEGNKYFNLGQHREAFTLYNMALSFAPNDSRAMKLAYSNKSALFYKIHRYQECINAIDKCFSLNCPEDLISKLEKRKEDAKRLLQPEETLLGGDYLNLKSLLNQAPYVSKNIKITEETNRTNVVATNNIKVGTIVAIEKAFVSNVADLGIFRCYFCQKLSLNLCVPCDGCCHVLFCSEKCKNICMAEYHKIECDIMCILINLTVPENLMFKSIIKLVLNGTWEELIDISNNIEANTAQFDAYSRFSVLNLRDDKPFKFGQMYNSSIICAMLIRYLDTIPSFFPESPMKRLHAIRALGRIMMFIVLNCKPRLILQAANNVTKEFMLYQGEETFGLYPLFENFKQSCEHNVMAVFMKNKMMLIAIKPIESGSEITMPYITFDYEMKLPQVRRHGHSFKYNGDVCKMCANNMHNPMNIQNPVLTPQQQEAFIQILSLVKLANNLTSHNMYTIFTKLCDALAILSNVSRSNEYKTVYEMFRNCLRVCLLHQYNNE